MLFTILSISVIYPHANPKVAHQSEPVEQVIIRGYQRVPLKEILSLIHTKHGDKFDQSVIDDDVHRLDATGHFEQVSVNIETSPEGGKIVAFEVLERPLIGEVTFEGISESEQQQIKLQWQKQSTEINVDTEYNREKTTKAIAIMESTLSRSRKERTRVYCLIDQINASQVNIRFSSPPGKS
jgi:outer membrane protein assembly factor BamA